MKDTLYECIEGLQARGMKTWEIIDVICVAIHGRDWWPARMAVRKILRYGAIYENWM